MTFSPNDSRGKTPEVTPLEYTEYLEWCKENDLLAANEAEYEHIASIVKANLNAFPVKE